MLNHTQHPNLKQIVGFCRRLVSVYDHFAGPGIKGLNTTLMAQA